MNQNSKTVHYRACNLCEAICGLEIAVEHGDIVSIRGDRSDPFSRGHICPKAVSLQDIHNDPDRLKHPLRRTGGGDENIPSVEKCETAENKDNDEDAERIEMKAKVEDFGLAVPAAEKDIERNRNCEESEG